MCIIVVKPQGIPLPNMETLKTCFDKNPHGAGIAVLKSGEVETHVVKGFFDFEVFFNEAIPLIDTQDIALLHFRIASHGAIDEGNCHPFVITKDIDVLRTTDIYTSRTVVAHNGIIGMHEEENEHLSDTQIFIKNVLADESIYDTIFTSEDTQDIIKQYIGSDRLAFLNPQEGILLIGRFIKDNGLYYSNEGYISYPDYGYDYSDYMDSLMQWD